MNDEYGSDFFTITDEEGNEFELEHLDTVEINDELYMAFLPADIEEDDDDYGLVILKVIQEDEEDLLISVDDEDELNSVFQVFHNRLIEGLGKE
jgi:uncharacterized protein YrzB (UPF0473 family)